jgi:hypothetical protein
LSGFRDCGIWPLNPSKVNPKLGPHIADGGDNEEMAEDDDEEIDEPAAVEELSVTGNQIEDADNDFSTRAPCTQYYVNISEEEQSEIQVERVVPPDSELTAIEDSEEAEQNVS